MYSFKNENVLSTCLFKDIGANTIQGVRTHAVSENAVALALGLFLYAICSATKRGGPNDVALIYCAAAAILIALPDQEERSC